MLGFAKLSYASPDSVMLGQRSSMLCWSSLSYAKLGYGRLAQLDAGCHFVLHIACHVTTWRVKKVLVGTPVGRSWALLGLSCARLC